MLFEIRNYHFAPEKLGDYQQWAEQHAIPHLSKVFDVVGFWIDAGELPEVSGSSPIESSIGHANVTWIIRWPDKASRDQAWQQLRDTTAWQEVTNAHPDRNAYRQIEVRFAASLLPDSQSTN